MAAGPDTVIAVNGSDWPRDAHPDEHPTETPHGAEIPPPPPVVPRSEPSAPPGTTDTTALSALGDGVREGSVGLVKDDCKPDDKLPGCLEPSLGGGLNGVPHREHQENRADGNGESATKPKQEEPESERPSKSPLKPTDVGVGVLGHKEASDQASLNVPTGRKVKVNQIMFDDEAYNRTAEWFGHESVDMTRTVYGPMTRAYAKSPAYGTNWLSRAFRKPRRSDQRPETR